MTKRSLIDQLQRAVPSAAKEFLGKKVNPGTVASIADASFLRGKNSPGPASVLLAFGEAVKKTVLDNDVSLSKWPRSVALEQFKDHLWDLSLAARRPGQSVDVTPKLVLQFAKTAANGLARDLSDALEFAEVIRRRQDGSKPPTL